MFPSRRRRLLVDFKVQGALLVQSALYWFYCLLSVALIASCWIVFTRRPATSLEMFRILWRECAPGLLGSVLLLPLVLMDCLRISHRFAGPMVRLRAAMKQLATGKTIAPVRLRDGDFWKDFADDLNQLADRVATHRESICSSADGCVSGRSSEAGASDAALEQQLKSAI